MKIRNAVFAALMAGAFLTGCQGSLSDLAPDKKAEAPLPDKLVRKMKTKGMSRTSPIMVRLFKEEAVLEVWKRKDNGKYDLIADYEICKWSGKLGPKFIEGDRQAPEGFYTVRPAQMNPNSQYYLSFNLGFPNAYDRAHGRTGQHLMVHGACSSAGCYSMTDESVQEIYAFGRDAFEGGQRDFQVQAYPFRMTSANMARYRNDTNYQFWTMLKQGYDTFETTKVPPKVDVCEKRYVFNVNTANGEALSPNGACPPSATPANMSMAYAGADKSSQSAFGVLGTSGKPASPSIAGLPEAKLVAAWSAARARGERVSREPPSLSTASAEKPNAPDIAPAAVTAQAAPVAANTSNSAEVATAARPSQPQAVNTPASETAQVTTSATAADNTAEASAKKPWWKIGGS